MCIIVICRGLNFCYTQRKCTTSCSDNYLWSASEVYVKYDIIEVEVCIVTTSCVKVLSHYTEITI